MRQAWWWVDNWWSWLMDVWGSLLYFFYLCVCVYLNFHNENLRKIVIVTCYWLLIYFWRFININVFKPHRNCVWFSKMWIQCQKFEPYLRSYPLSDRAKVWNPDLSDSSFCFYLAELCWFPCTMLLCLPVSSCVFCFYFKELKRYHF